MKNLLNIAVFSVLLLIGCSENSITDPAPYTGQKTNEIIVSNGTILLEGMLQDPHPVMNSFYLIQGAISYQHNLYFLHPVPLNTKYFVSLNLSVQADFTYLCTVCQPPSDETTAGTISEETNDEIYLTVEGDYTLIKTFEILGRNDGMVLKCSFTVTPDGIDLNEMWLEINGGAISINHYD